jgi:acylphosphatase
LTFSLCFFSCYNQTPRIKIGEADMTKSKTRVPDPIRLHAIVSGIVQGVNFRYYTARQAQSLGVTGWVANRWDGAVEVVAEGTRAQAQSLLDWLQHGPPSANVTGVEENWERATGEFAAFNVRYL